MPGLFTVPRATLRLLPAAPRLLARASAPAVGVAAGAAAGTARAGVRGMDTAVRVARVARGALPGGGDHWRSGTRSHLALRPLPPEQANGTETPAARPAAGGPVPLAGSGGGGRGARGMRAAEPQWSPPPRRAPRAPPATPTPGSTART
ncbi:hypothetical protein, partial [Streptomyces misionensis]|uniref:hypothetical protein n=1 Tax=Streptomyces misionensis TaxID=67331 RepID=UPI0016476D25